MLRAPYIWVLQKSISFLSEKFIAKFLNLILDFPVSWKDIYLKYFRLHTMCIFQGKMTFLLCPSEEMSPQFKLHIETFSYFVKWFHFLMLTFYQVNKTGDQRLIQNFWSSRFVLLFLDMSCLLPGSNSYI